MDRSILDPYEAGGEKLAQAVAGLTATELKAVPLPGKWSTHQLVVHLADAEAAFADRIRRIIAMDEPPLLAWDEKLFTQRLHYDQQSASDAIESVRLARAADRRILRALDDAQFNRTGIHNQRGPQTLAEVIAAANAHLEHHLKFLYEKRANLGKPLKDV